MVDKKSYVPRRGDVVWLPNLYPQPGAGHERTHLLAVVLSPEKYNGKTGLALFCPIIREIKGNPYEVHLLAELPYAGVILSDQIKSLDWKSRNATFVAFLPKRAMDEVFAKLKTLFPY